MSNNSLTQIWHWVNPFLGGISSIFKHTTLTLSSFFKSTGTIEHRFEKNKLFNITIFFTILQTCFNLTAKAINVYLVAQNW